MPDFPFTASDLRRLAGDTVFKRGEAYVREGAVRLVEVTPGRIEAEVSGSEIYETTLSVDADGEIEADCTCPHADEGNFCKHAVATGLAALASRKDGAPAGGAKAKKGDSDKAVLEKHLRAMTRDALEARLRKAMEDDPALKRALTAEALAAKAGPDDRELWRRLIENAFRATRTMGWESAGDFPEALDGLESSFRSVLSPATAPMFLDFIEEIIVRGEEATDGGQYDPEGEVADALERLGMLHRDACKLAGFTPEVLAERLFKLETQGRLEFVGFGPDDYAEALGPAGLLRYRELVEELAKKSSGSKDDWRLTSLRSKLAELTGDVDGRIAILESRPHASVFQIITILREAGRESEALTRAERALRENKNGPGYETIGYLIDSYSKAGRHADAVSVAKIDFIRSPDLSGYKRLLALGRTAGCEAGERETALKFLADRKADARDRFFYENRGGKPDRTLRIEIALWENDLQAGLAAYDEGWVSPVVSEQLASSLSSAYPADSLRIRRRRINALLEHTDAKTYPDVARQLGAMLDTANAAGTAGEVVKYIREIREKHRAKRSLMALFDKLPAR